MKKFTLPKFPKLPQFGVVYKHFKKKPSRLIVWVSIFAVLIALVVTVFNPKLSNKVKAAPGIEISGNQLTLRLGTDVALQPCHFDNTIRACGFYDTNNDGTLEWIYYNHYIIDVDGYLMVRYYPENRSAGTYRDYGFEYVYFHKLGDPNRFQLTSSTDLTIEGSNTVVYMEGNKARPLKLNSLTVIRDAVLTQIPANKDGINVPYSTNTAYGVQLFGYYYLGPGRQVAFRLNDNGNTVSSLVISTGKFLRINTPDTQWGSRYTVETNGKIFCRAQDNDDFCASGGARVIFQNAGANGIFLATMLNINRPTDSKITAFITQFENDLPGAINWAIDDYMTFTKKFVPIKVSSDPAIDGTPDGVAGNDTYFPRANNSKIGMAYYVDSYGVLQNHKTMDSSTTDGFIYDAPRMFQDVSLNMENDLDLNKYGIDVNETEDWGGQNDLQNFYWIWEDSNLSYTNMDKVKSNPLSYSRIPEGEDYLRTTTAKFVTDKMIGDQVPGEPDVKREARINLELTSNLNIIRGGQINVTAKGYPGGITDTKLDYSLPENSIQFSSLSDNPIRGAGYGGGLGTYGPDDGDYQYGCSGSYGGNGVSIDDNETYSEVLRRTGNADSNKWSNDIYCGQSYGGGKNVISSQELGSGGGYYRKRFAGGDDESIGGSGGGSVHIKAANIIIDNNPSSGIFANGGNGLTAVQRNCNFDAFGNIINCAGGLGFEVIETKGFLGQIGLSKLEQSAGYYLNPAPQGYVQSVQGTAGSGGSIWLESASDFNNQGTIEARGAQGALRYRNGNKSNYYTYYGAFNSIMKCPNSTAARSNDNCRGSAAGGGRIAILYGTPVSEGNIFAWGGGVGAPAEQTNDQKDLAHPIGGEGSVVYLQANAASTNVRNMDIEKLVNRLDRAPADCNDAILDINPATTESWADGGDWVAVNINVTNNTTKSQDGVTVKDELFKGVDKTTGIQCSVTNTPIPFGAGDELSWTLDDGFAVGTTQTVKYYFKVDATTD